LQFIKAKAVSKAIEQYNCLVSAQEFLVFSNNQKPKTKNQKIETNKYKKGDFPVAERVSQEIVSLLKNADLSDEEIEQCVKKLLIKGKI
jgi:dTDP-4-amino-4,6-dideoxygalactose transaminase